MCWGRGKIPASGCSNQLISTDGHKVVEGSRASSRYQLLGRLDEGDVSLTIMNVSESDAGRYGCRVEISGLYNDEKHHFELTVVRGVPTTPSTTPTRETPTEPTAANHTTAASHMTAQLTSSESLFTSSSSSSEAELQKSGSANVVLVCVLFGLIALVTAGGFFFIVRRRRQRNKMSHQQVGSSVQFSSSSSNLQLHRRSSTVDNIYQMDGGGEEGDYEYCP